MWTKVTYGSIRLTRYWKVFWSVCCSSVWNTSFPHFLNLWRNFLTSWKKSLWRKFSRLETKSGNSLDGLFSVLLAFSLLLRNTWIKEFVTWKFFWIHSWNSGIAFNHEMLIWEGKMNFASLLFVVSSQSSIKTSEKQFWCLGFSPQAANAFKCNWWNNQNADA